MKQTVRSIEYLCDTPKVTYNALHRYFIVLLYKKQDF